MICHILASLIFMVITLISYILSTSPIEPKIGGRPPTKLQKETAREYGKYKRKKVRPTFNEFCFPRSYSLQPQQAFAGEYMKPGSGHDSMLIFHHIGAGKTCAGIQIIKMWRKRGKPLVVLPASLIPGFRAELRTPCAGTDYISEEERAQLKIASPNEYKEIVARSDKRIDADFTIMSYNKFAMDGARISAPILLIDEVQNVDNIDGTFYKSLHKWIKTHHKAPVVVMSGTPVFDSPEELDAIAKLLRIDTDKPITPASIATLFAGKVSFNKGAPSFTFPKAIIKVKKVVMSKHQAKWYKSEVENEMNKLGDLTENLISNDFYIKSRQRSNLVCPKGVSGMSGLNLLTTSVIKSSLSVYSCKYAALVKQLRKNKLSFVYTSFTGVYGIAGITKILKAFGWVDFAKHGPGPRRYAIFSGEETLREKDKIRNVFNSPANDDASQIQIIIGSPAIKEGVSLMRVRQCHIMELYWNHSRLAQIWGRVMRYCSHKTLPRDERDVKILLYAAVIDGYDKKHITPLNSIDLYMLEIADKKRDEAEPYVKALMDVAVDRLIHYP